ncbi:MAG: tetratricopeptide repeat protein [Gemmatimonadetes bacterium]|nr:tetratricopeptide repeat protein [Gemmatimonadota bacterium]
MAEPLLTCEEYDERAHREYDQGAYDEALATLNEGLRYYPHSVELYVGLGYTQLAREEYAWARQAFERGLVLDPNHEDALAGLGETLLWFGRKEEARDLFDRAREAGGDDLDLLMSIGRALYREKMYDRAQQVFEEAVTVHAESAEAAAALGYTLHRLGDDSGARRQLRRALHLDPLHQEARVYLGHMLYDRGDWAGALREYERIAPRDHWDPVAVTRSIELRRALFGVEAGARELREWEERLTALTSEVDEIELLLGELEGRAAQAGGGEHRIQLSGGLVLTGTWQEIAVQLQMAGGAAARGVSEFIRSRSVGQDNSVTLSAQDPGEFFRAGERAGLWTIEY